MTVTLSDISPDTILCVVTGEIDLLTAPTLREKLTGAINGVPGHLVIDLSAVRFLASMGLNVLWRSSQRKKLPTATWPSS